jgi:hypothetical protein
MEPAEIRKEIERRRARANELKVPQNLWALYKSYLRG